MRPCEGAEHMYATVHVHVYPGEVIECNLENDGEQV